MMKTIRFNLNGIPKQVSVDPERMLLWVLRTELELTGAKHSCGEGLCGSCTVMVGREAVLSCQYKVGDLEGKDVLTIEGLSRNGDLHPLQKAFMEHNALQCGFCTPGMILKAYELLLKNGRPTETEIAEALEGHLCRCGSYNRIIRAVQAASRAVRGEIS